MQLKSLKLYTQNNDKSYLAGKIKQSAVVLGSESHPGKLHILCWCARSHFLVLCRCRLLHTDWQTDSHWEAASHITTTSPGQEPLYVSLCQTGSSSERKGGHMPSLPWQKPPHRSQELSLLLSSPLNPSAPLLKGASSIHQIYRSCLPLVWYLSVFETKWEGWQSWHDISAFQWQPRPPGMLQGEPVAGPLAGSATPSN